MIDFGSNQQKWVSKKNSLAKRIEAGFDLRTTASASDVWNTIRLVAAEFEDRKGFMSQNGMRIFQLSKRPDEDVIGWGAVTKTGEMAVANWALGVRPIDGGVHFFLAFGRAISGKVEGAVEMEGFLNLLEARLQQVDPTATVAFATP